VGQIVVCDIADDEHAHANDGIDIAPLALLYRVTTGKRPHGCRSCVEHGLNSLTADGLPLAALTLPRRHPRLFVRVINAS
jgi:hypothetical protein